MSLLIFPWINRKELEKVYNELYSDSVVQKKHALGRIAVWKSRVFNKLPVAVESTGAFISANLEYQRAGVRQRDNVAVRNLYSIALIRFINHITENQQNTMYARSVHHIAAELGLPDWIVELRHTATHSELPALSILKVAADWCLNWLKEEFWEVQLMVNEEKTAEEKLETSCNVSDVLVRYQQHRFQFVNKDKYKPSEDLKEELNQMFETKGTEVCACLVEEGYLVMNSEQLSSLRVNQIGILEGDLLLPMPMVRFWKYLLQKIASHGLLMPLLLALQSAASEHPSLRNKLLYGWIYTLLYYNAQTGSKKDSVLGVDVIVCYRQLLDVCVQVPSPYSPQLIEWLADQISDDQLSPDKKTSLRQLVDLYFTAPTADEQTTDQTVQTLHTLKQIQDKRQEDGSSKWSKCVEPIDWSRYPIGLLPNQHLDYKSLELFSEETEMVVGMERRGELTEDDEDSRSPGSAQDRERTLDKFIEDSIVENVTKELLCEMEC